MLESLFSKVANIAVKKNKKIYWFSLFLCRKEGVRFRSPYDNSDILLTPEKSMDIQNAIGADIMMQLDDVVDVKITGKLWSTVGISGDGE